MSLLRFLPSRFIRINSCKEFPTCTLRSPGGDNNRNMIPPSLPSGVKRLCCSAILFCRAGVAAFAGNDTVVVDERFADGDRTSQTPAMGTPPYSSIPWQVSAPGAAKVSDSGIAFNTGNGPALMWGFFAPPGAPVSLQVGESLRFSFSYTYAVPAGGFVDFRFGLFQFGAGVRPTGRVFSSTELKGYFVCTGTQNAQSTGSRIYAADNAGEPAELFNHKSGKCTPVGDAFPSINAMSDTHVAVLTIARTAEDSVDVTASLDGGDDGGFSATDLGIKLTAFDCVAVFLGRMGEGNSVTISNIKIERTAP